MNMKKISFLFCLLVSSVGFSQVNWMTMNQALEAQKENPKKILIKFYTDWCSMCKRMDRDTFNHPEIAKYINENYYAVKFNAEGNEEVNFEGKTFANPHHNSNEKSRGRVRHQFAQYMNITAYPSTVFLDNDKNLITGLVGYFEAIDVEPYLALVATEKYKEVKTQEDWEAYRSKFKGKVKK